MPIDSLLNPRWQVFLSPEDTTPAIMTPVDHTLNFCLEGEIPPSDGKAVLVNEFESPEAVFAEFGCSADFFMSVKFNNEILLDTLATGNKSQSCEITDYLIQLPVKAGKNRLEVTLHPGTCGWKFIYGDPDEARRESSMLFKTANTSYAVGFSRQGQVFNLHWGGRIDCINDLPLPGDLSWFAESHYRNRAFDERLEYPAHEPGIHLNPVLKLRDPDLPVNLRHTRHWFESKDHGIIELEDPDLKLAVLLHYHIFEEEDLISRQVEIINRSDRAITVEKLFSASWSLPRILGRLTTLQGEWGQEYQVHRKPFDQGETVLESRNGISGHQCVPFFAFDAGDATERHGEVWFGTLLWSGDWKFRMERGAFGESRVTGGLNDFDFELKLVPGEKFMTPEFLGGFVRGGFGEMTRKIHRYSRAHLYPKNMRDRVMPVVFNTYSCLRGNQVTEENVLALVPKAAEVGCELFIIDAGWQKSMGDWEINQEKFPGGFKKIIESVKAHGMEFGLWAEIERADRISRIYQEHPEYLIDHKNYSLLNLALPEVVEYVYQTLRKLLIENDITYFKMDFNRYFEIPEVAIRREMRTRYMLNFYALMRRISVEFPKVFFENCAAGSGRGDLAMDRYFARINRSDNQDTFDVLKIEEGFTYLHLPKMAGGGCQISHSYSSFFNHRKLPLQFMAHAALIGWPSLGIPLQNSSSEELAECKGYLELNRKIRHIVAFGEFYRLASIREGNYAAFEFVLPDRSEALLFVFGHALHFAEQFPNFRLEGLDPEAVYSVTRYGDPELHTEAEKYCYKPQEPPRPITGRGAAELGIRVSLTGDLDSRILHLKTWR